MARTYSKRELIIVLTNTQISGTIMYAIAPCSPVIFRNINLVVLGLKINQYNCVALVMLVILAIFGILTYFCLTNLTKHPGYMIYIDSTPEKESNKNGNEFSNKKKTVDNEHENGILSIKEIATDFNLVVVLLGEGLIGFINCLGEISINMVAMLQFHWTLTTVSIATGCGAVAATASMKFLQKLKGPVNTFYLYMLCVVMNFLFIALMLFTLHITVVNFSWQVVIYFTFLVLNIVAGYNSTAWARWLCFSIVPDQSSSTVDGYRYSVAKIGDCFGFFVAPLAYPVIAVMCILEYIGLFVSRKRFLNF